METVFVSIFNQLEFHLVQNRKEHSHHDYIPFNVKGNRNLVFSVNVKEHLLWELHVGECTPVVEYDNTDDFSFVFIAK